jgi:hypothetical protein
MYWSGYEIETKVNAKLELELELDTSQWSSTWNGNRLQRLLLFSDYKCLMCNSQSPVYLNISSL